MDILIFALAAYGKGLSGGDRIFIEFARRWSKKYPTTIYLWKEGYEICKRQKLFEAKGLKFKVLNVVIWCKLGFAICYLTRIIRGIIEAFKIDLSSNNTHQTSSIIYSASEFLMDSLPAFVLKIRFPRVKWMAAWYQTAPKPWVGRGSIFYWLTQLAVKPLISHFADFVLVNNEDEKKQFPKHNKENRAIVVLGAVDIKKIQISKFLPRRQAGKFQKLPKIYDCVFQGRFHPQKGVLELVDIWKKVVDQKPDVKLAMIGDGPLMENVKLQITNYKLQKNIKLFGWVFDGPKKYKIFSQSKVVVHPALFDSGGMASAEAMAFGIPCVGFNLKSYESYYPKGMVKIKTGDLDAFVNAILRFLDEDKYRQKIGREAYDMIKSHWSWDKRSNKVLSKMVGK